VSPTPDNTLADPQQIIADLQRQLAEVQRRLHERTAELDENEAQKAAMAEMLGIINSSPGNLAPVFDAMLEKAMNLCGAAFGALWTFDGQRFSAASVYGVPAAYAEFLSRGPQEPIPGSTLGQFVSGKDVVTMTDIPAGDVYRRDNPIARAVIDLSGAPIERSRRVSRTAGMGHNRPIYPQVSGSL
jgi:two-component system NtrC family sensor kinase